MSATVGLSIVDINWGMLILGILILTVMIVAAVFIIRYFIGLRREIRETRDLLKEKVQDRSLER